MSTTAVKTLSIGSLDTITEDTAWDYAVDTDTIKGHDIYYVNLDNGYSRSALVFLYGHYLKYFHAYGNMFGRDLYRNQLQERLRDFLTRNLFTPEEFAQPLKSYSEYLSKSDYLRNHYPCQQDYVSAFFIAHNQADREAHEASVAGKVYDPVCFGYFDDKEFVQIHIGLYNELRKRLSEKADDYDFYFTAFRYEMVNHEYHINPYQGNYDTLSAFGNLRFDYENEDENLEFYFSQLKFTDTQRRAYRDARNYYLTHCEY